MELNELDDGLIFGTFVDFCCWGDTTKNRKMRFVVTLGSLDKSFTVALQQSETSEQSPFRQPDW